MLRSLLPSSSTTLTLLCFTVIGTGCATTLPSPPIQTAPHDAPGTVGAGITEVALGGGLDTSVFNGSLAYGSATIRHGITESTELDARVTAGRIAHVNDDAVNPRLGVFALRLGFARDLVPDILMAFAGIGGGVTGAGGYVGMDYGLSLGFDNRYVVPFVSASMSLSTPVTRVTIDFTQEDDDAPNLRRAYSAFGFGWATGLRVPYGGHKTGAEHTGAFDFVFEGNQMFGHDPRSTEDGLESIAYFGFYASVSRRFGFP